MEKKKRKKEKFCFVLNNSNFVQCNITTVRCLSVCPYTLLLVHPSIQPSIFSLAGHSHFAKQSSFLFITPSSAAPSFLSACSSSARPSFLNPSTPIGFFRGLSFECLFRPFFIRLLPLLLLFPRVFAAFFLSFFLSFHPTQIRRCEFVLPCCFVQSNAFFLFLATSGKGICERKTHDDVRKESYRNIGWTKHLHALLHMRRECSRSDSVENRSLESPIIAILLFSTITP